MAELDRAISSIKDLSGDLTLAPWDRNACPDEGAYNAQLAADRGWRPLDKRNFHLPAYQKVEICDVLTERKKLLCVSGG